MSSSDSEVEEYNEVVVYNKPDSQTDLASKNDQGTFHPSFQLVDKQGNITLRHYAISNKHMPTDEELKYFDPAQYLNKFNFLLDEVEYVQLEPENDFKTQTTLLYTLHNLLAEENLEIYMYSEEWENIDIGNVVIQTELKAFSAMLRRIISVEHYNIYKSLFKQNPETAFGKTLQSIWGSPPYDTMKILQQYFYEPHVWRNYFYLLKATKTRTYSRAKDFLWSVEIFIEGTGFCRDIMENDQILLPKKILKNAKGLDLLEYYCIAFEDYKVKYFKTTKQFMLKKTYPPFSDFSNSTNNYSQKNYEPNGFENYHTTNKNRRFYKNDNHRRRNPKNNYRRH